MKIYDHNSKQVLDAITLFLSPEEALELASTAEDLARHPHKHHHHVSDSTYQTEITVAVHTADNLSQFDEESRAVIGGGS